MFSVELNSISLTFPNENYSEITDNHRTDKNSLQELQASEISRPDWLYPPFGGLTVKKTQQGTLLSLSCNVCRRQNLVPCSVHIQWWAESLDHLQ